MSVDPDRDPKGSSQAKVCQFDDALVVNEEVLGLEISVKHTTTVTEVYSLQDLVQVALNGTKGRLNAPVPGDNLIDSLTRGSFTED